MFIHAVVLLVLILVGSTNANADYSEQLDYRAKVTAIKKLPLRPNEDQVHYETQLELLTDPKDRSRCAFAKGSKETADLSPGQNEDVSFLKPGMEIEVVCEFQRYNQQGETKEIIFWPMCDLRHRFATRMSRASLCDVVPIAE